MSPLWKMTFPYSSSPFLVFIGLFWLRKSQLQHEDLTLAFIVPWPVGFLVPRTGINLGPVS